MYKTFMLSWARWKKRLKGKKVVYLERSARQKMFAQMVSNQFQYKATAAVTSASLNLRINFVSKLTL